MPCPYATVAAWEASPRSEPFLQGRPVPHEPQSIRASTPHQSASFTRAPLQAPVLQSSRGPFRHSLTRDLTLWM